LAQSALRVHVLTVKEAASTRRRTPITRLFIRWTLKEERSGCFPANLRIPSDTSKQKPRLNVNNNSNNNNNNNKSHTETLKMAVKRKLTPSTVNQQLNTNTRINQFG